MEKKASVGEFFASAAGRIIVGLVTGLIIFGLIFFGISSSNEIIAYIVVGVCIIFGWLFLNKITPSMFISMGIAGWIIFFLVKFLLSAVIGAFVAPVQIGKMVANAFDDDKK